MSAITSLYERNSLDELVSQTTQCVFIPITIGGDGVNLEHGVLCGRSCIFTNINNPHAEIERKDEFRENLIKCGTTMGANATIVCGHSLGERCFNAASAVVAIDLPAYASMVGALGDVAQVPAAIERGFSPWGQYTLRIKCRDQLQAT